MSEESGRDSDELAAAGMSDAERKSWEDRFYWNFYFCLSPAAFDAENGFEANFRMVHRTTVDLIVAGGSDGNPWVPTVDCFDEMRNPFPGSSPVDIESCDEAAVLIAKSFMTLDKQTRGDNHETHKLSNDACVHLYMLIARAALFLAAEAHYHFNIVPDQPPHGVEAFSFESLAPRERQELSYHATLHDCLHHAKKRQNLSFAASRIARLAISQVATNGGAPHARPGNAQAWFLLAQVDVLYAEIEASMHMKESSCIRPECRWGPATEEDGSLVDMDEDIIWNVSVPGRGELTGPPDRSKPSEHCQPYLADYWWGMKPEGAKKILVEYLEPAMENYERCQKLTVNSRVERQLRIWR